FVHSSLVTIPLSPSFHFSSSTSSAAHQHLHSFPTRRSSDLPQQLQQLEGAVIEQQVVDLILEKAKVEEKEMSYEETESQAQSQRSEEHTSELQSRFDLVCRLLLEKKKTIFKSVSNI